MAEVKCPSCGATVEASGATATCPFCGGAISAPAAAPAGSSSESAAPGNREERMAELMKRYEEAMTRGDHEAAAGFMEEYLRTSVAGMPGFETPEKVEAFVAESMKTFRQGMESMETEGAPGDVDDETILRKDSSDTEYAGEEEGEGSGKRGFMGRLKSLKDKVEGVIDAGEIIDDAKDILGG